jgi:SAM-dependent methyltransferase
MRHVVARYRKQLEQANLWADREIAMHRLLLAYYSDYAAHPIANARVLDVGCGWLAPQTILFHADGADAVGIDLEPTSLSWSFLDMLSSIRAQGVLRSGKLLIRHVFLDRVFFRQLTTRYSSCLKVRDVRTARMNAESTSFEAGRFDFIISNAVFEHIRHVERAVEEVKRLLSSRGIAAISIHLFPSLSGGHAPDELQAAEPWAHLRRGRTYGRQWLNRMGLLQYRTILAEHLCVLQEACTREGEELLSPELETELGAKGFTKEDLTTRGVTFISKKK